MNQTYTVKQIADILGYSTNSIYTFLKEGRIKGMRIGKGRFAIPQEELEKLLHLKKSQDINYSVTSSITSNNEPTIQQSKVLQEVEIPSLNRHLEEIEEHIPSLFDWFVSIVSVVLGFTIFLYIDNFANSTKIITSQFFLPIKINLFAAGIGLFFTNFFGKARKKWFYIFYIILLVNFIVYSLVLFLVSDLIGGFFFAIVSFVIIFHIILPLKGKLSFNIFISIFTFCASIVRIFIPSTIDLSDFILLSNLSTNVIIVVCLLLIIIINMIIWLPYKKKNIIYWFIFFVASLVFGYLSFLYSIQMYWGRALMCVLIALFIFIASFWNEINQNYKENKRIMKNVFCGLGIIFMIFITIILVIQNNIKYYSKNNLVNKLNYAQNFIESSVNSAQDKIEALSKNKAFIDAVKKNNTNELTDDIKSIFIFSDIYRKVLLVDKNGDLLSVYPYASSESANIAKQDDFNNIKASKKSYISGNTDSINGKYAVSINIPILDENKNLLGVISGSLNMGNMSNKLNQASNATSKEYFLIIDSLNRIVLQTQEVGKLNNQELIQLNSNNLVFEEVLGSVDRSFQVHNKINNMDWILAVREQLKDVYKSDYLTNFILCTMMLGAGLLIIFLNLIHLNE